MTKKIHQKIVYHRKKFHKKIIHHVYKHKHHGLLYIHIVLLLMVLSIYNFVTFNSASDIELPVEEPPIVIENEPEIISDESPITNEEGEDGTIETGSWDEEIETGEDGIEEVEDAIGEENGNIETGEQETDVYEEVISGSVSSGTIISGATEYFSGVVEELSGEVLYTISGDVIGSIDISGGTIVPTDLSGTSMLPQALSTIYPEQSPILNASGYISLESLFSVTTTGGSYGANYCSRIAYENISAILKAGVWTYRETNDFVLQGDADQLVIQGLEEGTMIEVTSGEVQEIFSGGNGTGYGYVYDLYISFMNQDTQVYHRVAVVYATGAEGWGWYVLDPLRGARTTVPQKFAEYVKYYDDEIDVHWYIGQAYIPSVIMEKFFVANAIRQLLKNVLDKEINGEKDGIDGVDGIDGMDGIKEQLTGELLTGQLTTGIVESMTGENLTGDDIVDIENNTGAIYTGTVDNDIQEEGIDDGEEEIIGDGNQGENISEEIDTGATEEIVESYFTKAYAKGDYSEKIIELQKLLNWMQLYVGEFDGIYSNAVIESVYQYQLANAILTEESPVSLRGYLGPTTRNVINKIYLEYQIDQLSQVAELRLSSCEKKDLMCRKKELEDTLIDKGYRLTKKGLVKMSKEVLIGSENLDMSEIRGELMMQVVLQSVNTLSGKIAEVSLPEGTIIKDGENKIFTDEIMAPEFISSEKITEEDIFSGKELVALIDVGADEHVHFEDAQGEPLYATLRIPVPGQTVGDTIEVKYSENGEDRFVLTEVLVQDINGEPYVVFESSHFTYFAIGAPIGTFMINDNASSTIATGVTLALDVPGATHMRFANTQAGIVSATWVPYASGYSWTLTNTPGLQTVYAQCSGSYGIQSIQDSILLDTTTLHPNLRVWIDSTLSGSDLLNQTSFGNMYNFATFGGLSAPIFSGEQMMSFNGTTQYAQTGNIGITNYPFTISAWVNPNTIAGADAIVMIGDSSVTNRYYGIQLTAGKASIVARNTTSYVGTSPEILVPGQRYHIVGVFNSATQRFIYVNGVRHAANTSSVTFSSINQQTRIGRYVGSSTNYFDGYIDDVRIYNTGLTDQEILTIYQSRAGGFERPIQYLNAGEFTINSGDSKTYTGNVFLIYNVSGATHMRFGNTPSELSGNSWIDYDTNYPWNIDTTNSGNKIVYAQFSGNGGIREAQDNIYFEKITDTTLKLLLDGKMNGTDVLDSTTNNYHLSGFGSLNTYNILGEQVLGFNGSSQYAQRGSIGITAYPFTFSAWINTNTLVGTDAIIAMGNSAVTNSYYAIQLVNGAPSIVARNTTTRRNSVQKIMTGQRYHIVGVFNSSNNRILYLNGVPMITATTTATFSSTNQQVRIGRYVGSSTNYFDGYIDDARIYSRALTSGEIMKMYQQRGITTITPVANIIYTTTDVTSGNVIATLTGFSEPITLLNNNGSGVYTFTGNGEFTFLYQDSDGNQGSTIAYVDWIDKEPPTFAGVTSGSVYTGILSGGLYIGNVSITFTDQNLSGATLNGVAYISGMIITGAGDYIFEVSDLAGNKTGASFTIYLDTGQLIHNQLISFGYVIGSTSLVPLDENYYIGTANIDMAPFTGQLFHPVVLQSTNTFGGDLAEVEIPAGAVLENAGSTPFVGILQTPEFQTPSTYETALGKSIISAIDVGSTNHIYFKDTGGNDLEVIFRIPVPGHSEGELIDIYTSEDGSSFDYHISTHVRLIGGQPYVIFTSTHFSVVVTSANNGTNLSADKAANSTSGSAYTALSNIVLTEGVNTDFGVSQSNVTLILTAPTNRKFRAGSGTVTYRANRDITSASIAVTDTTATITYSTNGTPNRIDRLSISNLWIQAISGNILPATGNILRTCANPGTATIVGITCDVTNFGTLSQTYGGQRYLVITLPGQEFVSGSGNSGTALNQITTVGFVIPQITAADQFYNRVASYTGVKTLSYTGPGGTPSYTTAVTFSGGQSTTTLNTILTEVKTGVTITVGDGVFSGPVSSAFDVRDRSATLSYSSTGWFENQITNNGSISGYIVVTLSTGAFSGAVANYVTFTNIPTGLTGVIILSGTKQVLISLSGNATSHAAANSISTISVSFTTGAFVDMLPYEVQFVNKTGLFLTFYDPNPTVGIYPSADTTLDADNEESHGCGAGVCQEYNYGALTYGGISDFGSKMLMKFSLTSVPAGSTITSATITLTKLNLGGTPTDNGTGFKLRKVINNSGWIEGTKSSTVASAGEPNYKQRKWTQEDWYNGDPGLIEGLDYEESDLLAIGGFTGAAQAQYTQTMPLSAAGVATLQDWLDNPNNNQGFALVDPNQNWIYIATKEHSTVGQRPLLTISYIVDTTLPTVQTFTPADNSSGVVLDTDLNIVFNEYVTPVSGKNIIIKKSVDNSIVETINAANTGIVVLSNGNKTITVNPTSLLQSNTGYYIQIESGAFIDRASNAFTGITDTTTWNFTTLDADSVPMVESPSISGLEYTSVMLGGTVTATGSSSVKTLGVVWSHSPGFDIASANILSQTGDRNNPGTFSLSIAGFNSGSTIYFRAFAANDQGTGYTNETGFILKPDVVQFGTATMISNDTFIANRSPVTGAAYYELYVSTGASCTSYISGYGPVITTGTSKRIVGLEKETTYYYKAIAVNSGGVSPVSTIHNIATSFLPKPWVWLKFEESAGTVAYDSSENFNHGVIYGTPLMQQTGAENKAYYFDAVNDFVAVTDFDMEPDLTVSFWFKKNTTGNNEHIFSRGNDTDANSINVIFDDATQSLRTYINGSQTILNVTGALYTGLLDNQRHFYSLTIADDESVPGKKLCTVFLDGINKLTDSSVNAGTFNPTPNINVGRRSITSAGTYYKGYVDDVRIYGKILTPPEINNLYLMFKDVTKPTATIEYDIGSGAATNGPVVATLTGASEPIVITNNGGMSGYTFTGNGIFTYTFRDEGFNTGEATAHVYWINPVMNTITGAQPNTLYTSNVITLTGYDVGVITGVSITTGTLYKNGVAVGQSTTGSNNDQFFIEITSSTGYLETITSTITIGITSGTYSVSTRDAYFSIWAPSDLNFDEWEVSENAFVVEKTFSGINEYFKITDNVGIDTGYYTTIQISSLDNGSGDVIPYTSIAIKALNSVETLLGTPNPNVYSSITGTYQYFNASPLTFIRRDTGANGGITGTYGLHTVRKIDVPALQNVGDYTGMITYTLYE